ncbi:MAG: hypothetical protein ACFFG0_07135 [Candidatus Thorarchaeota archaeon]
MAVSTELIEIESYPVGPIVTDATQKAKRKYLDLSEVLNDNQGPARSKANPWGLNVWAASALESYVSDNY